jgi:hypothetical protein
LAALCSSGLIKVDIHSSGTDWMDLGESRGIAGRRLVAWLGERPPSNAKKVFADRGYQATTCTTQNLTSPTFLAGLAAVVLTQTPSKLARIGRDITQLGPLLLDYDCRVIIRPASESGLALIKRIIQEAEIVSGGLPPDEGSPPGLRYPQHPYLRVFDVGVRWSTIANYIMEFPPTDAPIPASGMTIEVLGSKGERRQLNDNENLLLRRAFGDCTALRLVADETGRSGVGTFRAYAEQGEGKIFLPYFVKLGAREQIQAEYETYRVSVEPFIPFHLGPHVSRERYHLGASSGVMVINHVDESESLTLCASQGRAMSPISCLFERTLYGWQRAATQVESLQGEEVLELPNDIPVDRVQRAIDLGATRQLDELRPLFALCRWNPVMVGPIHGDLHASNVRVRGPDAVLVDFGSHRRAPIVYDPACLEASLVVDGCTPEYAEIDDWLESLLSLYDPFKIDPSHPDPWDRWSWLHSCIRQIRLYAGRMERAQYQYAAALSLALLKKASKDAGAPEPENSRRAVAYLLAERILVNNQFATGSA